VGGLDWLEELVRRMLILLRRCWPPNKVLFVVGKLSGHTVSVLFQISLGPFSWSLVRKVDSSSEERVRWGIG